MTDRAAPRAPAEETPISIRFRPEIVARLDRVAHVLSRSNVRIGRSSVVKLALERALTSLEAELAIEPSRGSLTKREGPQERQPFRRKS